MLWHQIGKLQKIGSCQSKHESDISNKFQEVVRHLEKLGEVGEEGWPVPEEAWTRLASERTKVHLSRRLKSVHIHCS